MGPPRPRRTPHTARSAHRPTTGAALGDRTADGRRRRSIPRYWILQTWSAQCAFAVGHGLRKHLIDVSWWVTTSSVLHGPHAIDGQSASVVHVHGSFAGG